MNRSFCNALLCGAVVILAARFASAQDAAPLDPQWQSYLAHVAAASASLRLNEPAEARRWLASAPDYLRGWEWRYLRAELDGTLRRVETGERGLFGLSTSADGSRLATCGTDKIVHVWDATTLKELRRLSGHEGDVHNAAFSPDGKRLVSASGDRTARVWDVESGRELATFRGHETPVGAVAWSADGALLASCAYRVVTRSPLQIDGEVFVWRVNDKGEITTVASLKGGNKPLVSLEFSRDGGRIAAASWASAIYVWDVSDGASPREFKMPESGLYAAVDDVALSPDGQWVVGAAKDRTARVWRVETGDLAATLEGHGAYVAGVAFSHDGKRLATGSADDTLRLWDTETWKPLATLRGHTAGVRRVRWSPDDSRLWSASVNGEIAEWDAQPARHGALELKHSGACYATVFSPDGARLYACGYDGAISVWDTRSGARLAHWSGHGASCNALTLSADGGRLFSAAHDKSVRVWDTGTHAEVAVLPHDQRIDHGSAAPDGKRAAATQDGGIWLWDVDKKERLAIAEHPGGVNEVRFNHKGDVFASSGKDGTVRLWKTADGSAIATLNVGAGVFSTAFSPDDSQLATGSSDGDVRVFDVRNAALTHIVYEGDDAITRIAWSPDGARIAASCNELLLIDPQRGGAAIRLRPLRDTIWHLCFSPDGARIAACSWDRTIAILDTALSRERHQARTRNSD